MVLWEIEICLSQLVLSFQQNTRLVHQIIFIDGFSGIGKTTLAKKIFEFLKKCDNEDVYIEQNMIAKYSNFRIKKKCFLCQFKVTRA